VQCRTELAPDLLACPVCAALVHADELKRLATAADAATRSGSARAARDEWQKALTLLPPKSQQYTAVQSRITQLTRQIEGDGTRAESSPRSDQPWWWRTLAAFGAVALLLGTKLKFLLLGLTKLSTFASMFAFFGVYWSIYGWPLALGIVVSIYIHEMGHVAMLRRLGIAAGAPLFIPGMGAVVMLKQHITDPLVDAKIGLAGPVWGLGAGLAAAGVYLLTGAPIWFAIAQITGFLNLFNLTPIWQLDGSRGMHVLSRSERWTVVGAIAVALLLTEQRLLFIVGAVAVWRALQRDAGPGNARVVATFVMLVMALSLLARGVK
jgi:Zn-dependent protease